MANNIPSIQPEEAVYNVRAYWEREAETLQKNQHEICLDNVRSLAYEIRLGFEDLRSHGGSQDGLELMAARSIAALNNVGHQYCQKEPSEELAKLGKKISDLAPPAWDYFDPVEQSTRSTRLDRLRTPAFQAAYGVMNGLNAAAQPIKEMERLVGDAIRKSCDTQATGPVCRYIGYAAQNTSEAIAGVIPASFVRGVKAGVLYLEDNGISKELTAETADSALSFLNLAVAVPLAQVAGSAARKAPQSAMQSMAQRRLDKALQTTLKHPKVKALLEDVEKKFGQSVAVKLTTRQEAPFGCYCRHSTEYPGRKNPKNPVIEVADHLDDANLIHCIVGELGNLSLAKKYDSLAEQAFQGSISKKAYATEVERVELNGAKKIVNPILEDLRSEGILRPTDKWISFTDPRLELSEEFKALRDRHFGIYEAQWERLAEAGIAARIVRKWKRFPEETGIVSKEAPKASKVTIKEKK